MDLKIEGGAPLRGTVAVPADKSILHRSLMFGGMVAGKTRIEAKDPGADNLSTANLLRALGVTVELTPTGFNVESDGFAKWRDPASPLDCGNSGTTMRLMAGVLAGAGIQCELIGDESLSRRPMGRVCKPLRELGASLEGNRVEDRELPPIRISPGGLTGGRFVSPVASAQIKSSLLLAGVCAGVTVAVTEPHRSRDHTERMLRAMGVQVTEGDEGGLHRVEIANGAKLKAVDFVAPGDVSSAAFLLAAGLLVPGSELTVRGVGLNATRTGVLEIIEELGGDPRVTAWREVGGEPMGELTVATRELVAERPGGVPTTIGGEVIPRLIDELVVLAAVASQARGVTEIRDAAELRVKESDRISETTRLLEAFGVRAESRADGLRIEGPQALSAADVDVSTDHRVALTAAVLALAAPGTSVLRGFDIAEVSFPGFVDTLKTLGAQVS